jgi:ankyrin repeat protein
MEGDTHIVELLIEKGADPNNRVDDVSTKYI